MRRLIGAVLAAVLLTTTAFSGPAAAATPTTGAIFNNPTVAGSERVIVDHIVSLIDGTPSGAEISVAMYAFDEQPVADALIRAARQRGVRVRVVLDATYRTRTPALALASATTGLGTDTTAGSWLKVCATDLACVSGAPASVNPINHNKFYLFSSTGGASKVLVQSSANLTSLNTGRYWNNAVTVVDNGPIYDAYRAYFGDLARALHNDSDYYRMTSSDPVKSYFFPRAGSTADTDTIVEVLNNVTCPGNDPGYGTVDGYTKIRIAVWKITREAIADKLRALANANCWVDIVYGTTSSGSASALTHPRIRTYQLNKADGELVHSKYLLIEGTYAGRVNSKWVFTGSHNYDDSSLRENDEAMLRINSSAIHDQYRSNFWAMRDSAQL
ncbi:phospholipase D-like domain-containing protein [Micromonospora mirobrigensis]|uniref:phospholipase D n=1 Tax=Micromonospora mirobrigensis TaxID=262898 RepID=A0A1C4ZIA8_9ACTN|nr:phospholipase D-like domain-containing protein [Micromonospora mirobrigensis]SCF32566.1 Phosphatidylserine/phosphatidylglycerophosphate/cardiolipin synthase [Micromonospora mirobrigensis]